MSFSKTAVLLPVMVLLFVPATLGEISAKDKIPDLEDRLLSKDDIEQAIQDALSPLANLSLAALPTISVAGVSLSLADLKLTGLNIVEVSLNPGILGNPALGLTMPRATLTAGKYVAGGHLLNMPFNGEGPMSVILHDLQLTLSFEWDHLNVINGVDACASLNSTNIDLDLRRMEVNFENLNPGSDQGQLINIMLSSFGPDIFDYVETFLDNEFYEAIDLAVVGAINSQETCKTPPSEDLPLPDLTDINIGTFVQQIVDHLTEFPEKAFRHY